MAWIYPRAANKSIKHMDTAVKYGRCVFWEEMKFMPIICLLIAAALIVIDQITKYLVSVHLEPVSIVTLIPGWLQFSYVENRGSAFGMLQNRQTILTVITSIALIAGIVVLFRFKRHNFFSYTAATLILAGGIGNLIDRVFRGYVIDFIHVMFFKYVFNFADSCVTVGAVFLAIYMLFFYSERGVKRPKESEIQ